MVRAMVLARIVGMVIGANLGGRLGVCFAYKWLGRKAAACAEQIANEEVYDDEA